MTFAMLLSFRSILLPVVEGQNDDFQKTPTKLFVVFWMTFYTLDTTQKERNFGGGL
jgi:hypothetical protein